MYFQIIDRKIHQFNLYCMEFYSIWKGNNLDSLPILISMFLHKKKIKIKNWIRQFFKNWKESLSRMSPYHFLLLISNSFYNFSFKVWGSPADKQLVCDFGFPWHVPNMFKQSLLFSDILQFGILNVCSP